MTFGKLGQEDHVLVLTTTDGSLIVKILKRTAEFKVNFDENSLNDIAMPAAGNLMIPKKTKFFVEQTLRERENASSKYLSVKYMLILEIIYKNQHLVHFKQFIIISIRIFGDFD